MRKRAILESVQNIGWALVFAVAIWLVMVQSHQSEGKVMAELKVHPPGLKNVQWEGKYKDKDQRRVELTVRGAARDIDNMSRIIEGRFQVPDAWPIARHKIPVRDFTFALEPGLEIDRSALTQEVEIILDQEQRGQLVVELDLDETPPEGWMIDESGKPRLEPRVLNAAGPIAKMSQEPRIKTEPLSFDRILQKLGFDPKSGDPQSFEQDVTVIPPDGIQLDQKTVKLRFSIRPRPKTTEIELTPAIQFPGPAFQGLPFKLVPLDGQAKIKLKICGPELDLLPTTIEKTKEKFTVFVKPRPEFFEKGSVKVDGFVLFDIVVIPPPKIDLQSEPDPKQFRFDVKPLDPEEK